jgi:hypothetical protein
MSISPGANVNSILVEAYSDADFAGDRAERKSVSGGVLLECGVVVG